MDFGPQQIGKWLIAAGIFIAVMGVLVMMLGRVVQTAGRPGVRPKKLACLYPNSKLRAAFDNPYAYPMAYQLFSTLKNPV
jgi:hypothetical protein